MGWVVVTLGTGDGVGEATVVNTSADVAVTKIVTVVDTILPYASVAMIFIACVPMSLVCGVQLKTPEELTSPATTEVVVALPDGESVTLQEGLVSPEAVAVKSDRESAPTTEL